MIFSTSIFLFAFLPLFILIYSIVDKSLKNYVILIASLIFYAWGAPKFIFILLASCVINFFVVRRITADLTPLKKKLYLIASIAINLGLLFYFKYANFFIDTVNSLLSFGGGSEITWTRIALPIGISFFTFQSLTYSLDVYRGVHAPLKKLSDYVLYIISFPQLIAGPIVRFNSIADQIINREEKYQDKLVGFYRFALGLSKKVMIANVMGEQADLIFNSDLSSISSATAWIGTLAYTFQIYFDFSGYSDMAIGLGKMMGFKFPENFDSPYTSKSISEFWRRWHITLGAFMRDYLYIPLGGNRVKSSFRLYFNLWIVFLLSGLWHGASWNFVLWGAFHGAFLILDRLFLLKILNKIGKIPSMLFTFFIVMIGWVLFRVEDFSSISVFIKKLFAFDFNSVVKTQPMFYSVLVFAFIFSFFVALPKGKQVCNFIFNKDVYSFKWHIYLTIFACLAVYICASFIMSSDFNPFIYFRF